MVGSQQVTVAGRTLALTNLDKVLYPQTGTTKGEVVAYYAEIGPVLLPHLWQRPITRKRWPDGVGTDVAKSRVFFAKNLPAGTPDWVRRYPIEHTDGTNLYPVADDLATLVWLAQLAALELHVPQWRFDADGTPLPPDRLVLDLDPGPGVTLTQCAEVAGWVRDALLAVGLDPLPVTSGSKGIHLYAHLDGSLSTAEASKLAKDVAQRLQAANPNRVTAVMRRADRDGKVFLDWSQNNGNKTTITPYSLRGRSHPTVAAPRTWAELAEAELRQLDLSEVLARVAASGDLLASLAVPETEGDAGAQERAVVTPGAQSGVATGAAAAPLVGAEAAAPETSAGVATTSPSAAAAGSAPPAQSAPTPSARATPGGEADLPTPAYSPMLATLATPAAVGDDESWAFEMKWDGVRTLVYLDGDRVRLESRRGRDETVRYPDLIEDLRALGCRSAVLDGEIVATGPDGAPRFELLQPRINLTKPGEIAAAAARTPVSLMLFDVLNLDGRDLTRSAYEERREALQRLAAQGRVQVPPGFEGDLAAALETSAALGLEGVVAKRRGSAYEPGRRSSNWLKIKHLATLSVVVGGWRPGNGNRAGTVGSLLLGIPGPDGLAYAGRVGSGFTDAGLAEAQRLLAPLAQEASPLRDVPSEDARDAHWVEPVLVGEVRYAERTSSGRLRQPVWLGWRTDLSAAQIRPE